MTKKISTKSLYPETVNYSEMSFCSKEHFQVIKGIAILMIMVAHAGNNSGVTWFTPLGGIGVALFLFCSGYGIYYSLMKNRGGVLEKTIYQCLY